MLFLSLQAITCVVIASIVILGFQKGSKHRFCMYNVYTKSLVSEIRATSEKDPQKEEKLRAAAIAYGSFFLFSRFVFWGF